MERKSCCSARRCCPSTRTVIITPKQEPVVTIKPPKVEDVKFLKVEDVKLETTKKVEGNVLNSVKVEDKKPGIALTVKKEEDVKVNVGCGRGASCN